MFQLSALRASRRGRAAPGPKEHEGWLGHGCWIVAGTPCRGRVQGTFAEKEGICIHCQVFRLYHRTLGRLGGRVEELYPEEQSKFERVLIEAASTA